jgi:hypothetical protein
MKTIFWQVQASPLVKRIRPGLLWVAVGMLVLQPAMAAVVIIDLGTATPFAILAGSGINNAGMTTIVGDVGSSPTATTAGFGTVTLVGTNHGGDAVTVAAKEDLFSAYEDAVSRTPTTIYGAIFDLGGLTLTSGVYNNPSSFGLSGTLTLDAQGDPNAVWIFQTGSTLTTAVSSMVVLAGGAQASHVFWQVGSSATLGTDSIFTGSLLAFTSITTGAGTTVEGRLLAQNGAVTLVNNNVVPEPRRLVLLGLGLVFLWILRQRASLPILKLQSVRLS